MSIIAPTRRAIVLIPTLWWAEAVGFVPKLYSSFRLNPTPQFEEHGRKRQREYVYNCHIAIMCP